jgi:hypothetical protein
VTGLEVALATGLTLAVVAAVRIWSALDDERRRIRGLEVELERKRAQAWSPGDTADVLIDAETLRKVIAERDRFQRQAIDLQLATNGLLAEREELFRELRRRAN